MITLSPTERVLAAMSLWGVLGSFGSALILTGMATGVPVAAALGSVLLMVGYFLHVLINWAAGFRHQQAFVSFRWFWALAGAALVLVNVIWMFG